MSLVFNLIAKDRASSAIARSSQNVRAANLASAASSVALKAAEASAAAWAISLGAAIATSIGLAPAIFESATASGIGLKLALGGLSEAWKAVNQAQGGGPSAAEVARQHAAAVDAVTGAQEELARAQRDALAAQRAISDAEEAAAKNLRDLTLNLAQAKLDEKSATLAVVDAARQLQAAQQTGNAEEIARANIEYQGSIIALQEAKNKTSDLAEENDKATKAGVEGSDQVVQARQQQADATQAVADATRRLAEAQANLASQGGGGGANAAAQAMAKLAPSARALITTLKQLSPAWASVRRELQQNTFAGVAKDVRALSSAYLPTMRARLGDMGNAFNSAIRASLGMLRSKQTVSDVNVLLKNTATAVGTLGRAFAPLISGLLGMGAAGSSFLPQMAGWVSALAQHFNNWVNAARRSGELQAFMQSAYNALHGLAIVGYDVVGIIGDIFKPNVAAGGGLLNTITQMTTKMHAFLSSAQGQQDIARVFGDLRDILGAVGHILPGLVSHIGQLGDVLHVGGAALHFVAQHTGTLVKLLPLLAAGYVIVKTAQAAHYAVEVVQLPVTIALAVSNFMLARANKALAGEMRLARVATMQQTVAQTELDAAMDANPIGAIILAIMLLVGAFIYLWNHSKAFRDFWKGLWKDIQIAAKAVADWFMNDFVGFFKSAWHWFQDSAVKAHDFVINKLVGFVTFVNSIPGRIAGAARRMWDGMISSFKGMINFLIRGWNALDFGIHIHIPSWVPGIGGKGIDINDVIPDIPYLAKGGRITAAGAAVVGDDGAEVLNLPAGATVTPLKGGGGGGQQVIVLRVEGDGSAFGNALVEIIRRTVRVQGGNAQVLGIIQ